MKLSLNWLKNHVDHGLSAEDLARRMTMSGLEVEHIEQIGTDTVFEIEVTPNRPDCLSILGLAREVSAITDRPLIIPTAEDRDESGSIDITIEDPADCVRYIGTRIDGVRVSGFPEDRAVLLRSVGINALSNIVDVTNFVLFETGQPLHAFDLDKLEGGKIIVRRARKGETLVTLDNIERKLDENILVIADARRPVAIAGIMGGRDTGVTAATQNILLESAVFDQGLIRRASRRLALSSDACYRFERGVAYKTAATAADRATAMIMEFAGGTLTARRDLVAREIVRERREVTVSQEDIRKLLGSPLDLTRCAQILRRLGCIVASADRTITVIPPHFRNDITIREDVIEEIARVVGYDTLEMTLPRVPAVNIAVDPQKNNFLRHTAETMIALGYNQIITYALVGSEALKKINYSGSVIRLQNPMSAEQEMMRPTALAGMLGVAAANLNAGQKDLRMFEIGKRYLSGGERWSLSILACGRQPNDWRMPRKQAVDLFDLKGALQETLNRVRVPAAAFQPAAHSALTDGQTAGITLAARDAGMLGRVSDEVLARFDIKKTPVYFAEFDLELAEQMVKPRARFQELNDFPAITRDVSLAVAGASEAVTYEALRSECLIVGGSLLKRMTFLELYTGDKIEPGCKGYVFSLTYQSDERTLTDEEVSELHQRIISRLTGMFAVKVR